MVKVGNEIYLMIHQSKSQSGTKATCREGSEEERDGTDFFSYSSSCVCVVFLKKMKNNFEHLHLCTKSTF